MSTDSSQSPDNFREDLKPFEAMLGSLRPIASRIDRDRLMYDAGAAASVPAAESMRATTSGHSGRSSGYGRASPLRCCFLSATLGVALVLRGPSSERIVYVSAPVTASILVPATGAARATEEPIDSEDAAGFRLSRQSNLVLRERALRLGVDAIDIPSTSAPGRSTPEIDNRALLNQMLGI